MSIKIIIKYSVIAIVILKGGLLCQEKNLQFQMSALKK